ncbi:MAG: hydrogenase expression/formation protein HypE [Candidatus Hydrothermarchaeaceae archaeon]
MGHGAGGELMNKLIADAILKNLDIRESGKVTLKALDDGASITLGDKEIVFTTDGHTVKPIFFPGGDIGRLAACGTINDVAVMGARPLALACSLIIEEGFLIENLERIIKSLNSACREVDVSVATGDTKVMERGSLESIVVTTTGVGIVENGRVITDAGLRPGDRIIVSGTVGDHGVSLMSFREDFGFETTLKSDVAPVWGMVENALEAGNVHAMKDPTRGGIAAALNEFSRKSQIGIVIDEERIPLRDEVVAASEMLGIDPYTVACEGKILVGVARDDAEEVLKALRGIEPGRDAEIIGDVVNEHPKRVVLRTSVGGKRLMEMPVGDPVPRVC